MNNNWELKIGRREINRLERAKYAKYFAPPRAVKILVNPGADVPTTIQQIQSIVKETLAQTKEIAKVLSSGTSDVRVIASRIHAFVWNCLDYDEEEVGAHLPADTIKDELLREPSRIWADQKGDCDCFTILISSILSNLHIPHALRVAKYEYTDDLGHQRVGDWQHIYVVIPQSNNKYIIIDGVLSLFDREHPFYEAQDFHIMPTYRLGNLPAKNTDGNTTKATLQSMLNMVNRDPLEAANFGYEAEPLKKMLNYAIANWDKNSGEVLRILAQEEANMNTLNGFLGSIDDPWEDEAMQEELQYLQGFGAVAKKKAAPKIFAKAKAIVKKVVPKVKPKAAPKPVPGKPKANTPGKPAPKKNVVKNLFNKIKDKVTGGDGKFELKDAARLYTKVPMAPARLMILLAIKANTLKLKDHLKSNPAKYAQFEKEWFVFGGEKKALHDTVFGKGAVVNGLLGALGVALVDDAAVLAAGAAPAAGFLAKNSELFKKINLKDILAMLKSLFKKKDKSGKESLAEGESATEEAPHEQEHEMVGSDGTGNDGSGTGSDGSGSALALRKTGPIYDKDSDGKDDESGFVYQDDGSGKDVTTGREIKKGKGQNFFIANPMITAGIIAALVGGGFALYHFVLAPKKAQKQLSPRQDLQGLPPKRTSPKRKSTKRKSTKQAKAKAKPNNRTHYKQIKPRRLPLMA